MRSDGSVTYPFLSPEWVTAARGIRERYADRIKATGTSLRINHVITDTPFGTVEAHIDTSAGAVTLDLGHLDSPDATVTVDYDTAKEILLTNDPQVMMRSLLMGKLKVDGDASAVVSLQSQLPQDDASRAAAEEILNELRAITT